MNFYAIESLEHVEAPTNMGYFFGKLVKKNILRTYIQGFSEEVMEGMKK